MCRLVAHREETRDNSYNLFTKQITSKMREAKDVVTKKSMQYLNFLG